MGKSYRFECTKCGYRAVVSGGRDEGRDVRVQTVRCRDCRALYDCVIGLRVEAATGFGNPFRRSRQEPAPSLQSALARLPVPPTGNAGWKLFDPMCPRDATHRIEPWSTPGRCPRCRAYLEGGGLPFRVWE